MKNPLLSDPSVLSHFDQLDDDSKAALKAFCAWLYEYSRQMAEKSWKRSKAPMAMYWKCVAAWAYHIKRAIKV